MINYEVAIYLIRMGQPAIIPFIARYFSHGKGFKLMLRPAVEYVLLNNKFDAAVFIKT